MKRDQGWFGLLMSLVLLGFAAVASAQTRVVDGGAQVQIGRYSSQAAEPSRQVADPMLVMAQLSFPRGHVKTVGDALSYALMRTGYRLVAPEAMAAHERDFLGLPLPESQRSLGPYPVHVLLSTVLGPAWELQQDPLKRQVWFRVAESHRHLLTQSVVQPVSSPAGNEGE